MNTRTYPDIPDWVFFIDEISVGVYEVIARDNCGREISDKGTDVTEIIEKCRKQAIEWKLRK
jgi:hypothetical protein